MTRPKTSPHTILPSPAPALAPMAWAAYLSKCTTASPRYFRLGYRRPGREPGHDHPPDGMIYAVESPLDPDSASTLADDLWREATNYVSITPPHCFDAAIFAYTDPECTEQSGLPMTTRGRIRSDAGGGEGDEAPIDALARMQGAIMSQLIADSHHLRRENSSLANAVLQMVGPVADGIAIVADASARVQETQAAVQSGVYTKQRADAEIAMAKIRAETRRHAATEAAKSVKDFVGSLAGQAIASAFAERISGANKALASCLAACHVISATAGCPPSFSAACGILADTIVGGGSGPDHDTAIGNIRIAWQSVPESVKRAAPVRAVTILDAL